MVTPANVVNPAALECRICHARYPVEPLTICEECFGPLEPAYDLEAIDGFDFRKQVEAGPASMWRYQPLLPGGPDLERIDLGAGFTPLRRADNLAARLGLQRLWIKDDSVNPSNSFKDRVVTRGDTMARAFGFEAISCASTGNLANATAAHAAKAGMPCYVFVPDDLERAKILATEVYGAKVVTVKGNYDEVNRLCSEVAEALPASVVRRAGRRVTRVRHRSGCRSCRWWWRGFGDAFSCSCVSDGNASIIRRGAGSSSACWCSHAVSVAMSATMARLPCRHHRAKLHDVLADDGEQVRGEAGERIALGVEVATADHRCRAPRRCGGR